MRSPNWFVKSCVSAFALFLFGCGSDLWVTSKDFSTLPGSNKIQVTVTFNKSVDQTTVVPGISLILAGKQDSNASGNAVWTTPSTLQFTTVKSWGQIVGPGGPDTGFTLTLKSTIRATDRAVIDQCKSGKPGTESAGDCVLYFTIPG